MLDCSVVRIMKHKLHLLKLSLVKCIIIRYPYQGRPGSPQSLTASSLGRTSATIAYTEYGESLSHERLCLIVLLIRGTDTC